MADSSPPEFAVNGHFLDSPYSFDLPTSTSIPSPSSLSTSISFRCLAAKQNLEASSTLSPSPRSSLLRIFFPFYKVPFFVSDVCSPYVKLFSCKDFLLFIQSSLNFVFSEFSSRGPLVKVRASRSKRILAGRLFDELTGTGNSSPNDILELELRTPVGFARRIRLIQRRGIRYSEPICTLTSVTRA